jgi:hypothetical protein
MTYTRTLSQLDQEPNAAGIGQPVTDPPGSIGGRDRRGNLSLDRLLAAYISLMPPGLYHRRDDDSCGLYRDGSKVFDLVPADRAVEGLVSAMVLILNQRRGAQS